MDDTEGATPSSSSMDTLFSGANPASAGDEPSPAAVEPAAETPTPTEKPPIEAAPAEPVKKEAAKADGKTPPAEAKADTKSVIDWDSDDNPHKKRLIDLEKSHKGLRDWASQREQRAQILEQQLALINKKLDGTYDPAVDDPRPDPHRILTEAQIAGAIRASADAAKEKYGERFDSEIERFHTLFDNNGIIQHRVLSSPSPMIEAMKVLEEFDISQKYNSTDVNVIVAKIKEEAIAELREQIRKEEHQKIMDSIAMKNKTPSGLREVRTAGGGENPKPAAPKPLSSLFTN